MTSDGKQEPVVLVRCIQHNFVRCSGEGVFRCSVCREPMFEVLKYIDPATKPRVSFSVNDT